MTGSLRIEDYAVIGDCRTGALVGRNGSIDWLCWPRFDSPACFTALLGTREHGRWLLAPADPAATSSRAYRGDTNVLETVFETAEGSVAIVDFMPMGRDVSSVVRRVEGRGGRVAMAMELLLRFDYGSATPWTEPVEGGASALSGPNLAVLHSTAELGLTDGVISAGFTVGAGETVTFALSWGLSHEAAPEPFDTGAALAATLAFWEEWASRCTYTGPWRAAVLRSMLTLKALTYLPTGGIVAALTTSLPEQIGGERNWDYRYCWLRDATLTAHAFLGTGYRQEAEDWCAWLHRASAGPPEERQIMYGISGERMLVEWSPAWLPGYEGSAPVHVGNGAVDQLQLDVSGEVVGIVHLARRHKLAIPDYAWGRQSTFVEHLIGCWEEPDEGIWEVRGGRKQFTMSKVMAWVAMDWSVQDAERLGLEAPLDRWREVRDRMHAVVCEKGFDPARNTFTQSFGSQALDASLLSILSTGFLPPDDKRVLGTVAALERELMEGGLLLRYRTGEAGEDGLAGEEGAFLACSFWLVGAYYMTGREEEARALFERLLGLANDVGLMAEEYDPKAGRQLGNFPQAFSHLALIIAALTLGGESPLRQDRAEQRG